jgi:hypothetical protein
MTTEEKLKIDHMTATIDKMYQRMHQLPTNSRVREDAYKVIRNMERDRAELIRQESLKNESTNDEVRSTNNQSSNNQ